MGQQQSQNKDKLLYQHVKNGNIEMIKALFLDGARLEWANKEGKTPLIAACLKARLYDVAKTLLKLGANVNTYCPGTQAGTPLHHAAKSGLEQTVELLLSHGANASVTNYDCQTPMDVARAKGYKNVVRTIENHICLFSGWLRELHVPGFLEESTCHSKSNYIWAVVIPSAFRSPTKPPKLLLFIYCTQDAQPRSVILLWKAKIEEPEFHQLDPTFVIFDEQTETRYKFASEDEGDKQQLQCFYNACTGISQVLLHELQVIRSSIPQDSTPPIVPETAPPTTTEVVDLATGIKASIDSAMVKKPPQYRPCHSPELNHTNGLIYRADENDNDWWFHLLGAAYPSKDCSSKRLNKPVNDMYNGPSSSATKQRLPSDTPIMRSSIPQDSNLPIVPAFAPPTTTEDVDLAMGINASIDSAMVKKPPQPRPCHSSGLNHTNGLIYRADENDNVWWLHLLGAAYPSKVCSSKRLNKPVNDMYNGPSSSTTKQRLPSDTPIMPENPGRIAIPSAPPIPDGADYGPEIDYNQLDLSGRIVIPSAPPIPEDEDSVPETNSSPIDLPGQCLENKGARKNELKEDGNVSSACAICWDAPREGACLPCGHRAGCMSCLNELKAKKCGCPLCRAKIQQVVRIYDV
ncbi:hypothetical protein AQUCO_03400356v1 [Aquilegia coerulea]|uniref:RING-type domain-containing protein n=1 Tax=Aquilegia coerulea TaxID=218851 RepID=A0A2G5CYR7_AQUCA|nr:hypothetical protein AQUCO_03400356v1 [Aquilegia coerulea]